MDIFIYLPEITDNSSVIKEVRLHWLVKDEDNVNQGDKLMEVSTDTGAKYSIVASKSGLLVRYLTEDDIIVQSYYSNKNLDIKNSSKVCIGGIYDSSSDFVNAFYKFKSEVEVDSFTNEKSISWVYVAEPTILFHSDCHYDTFHSIKMKRNNLNRKNVSMETYRKRFFLSGNNTEMSFSLDFTEGKSSIELSCLRDNLNLKKGDIFSFLFANGNTVDLRLLTRPYRKEEKSKFWYSRIPLFAEDLENLTSSQIVKWRVTFDDECKPPITNEIVENYDVISNDSVISLDNEMIYYSGFKYNSLIIQNYAKYYCGIVKKKFPEFEFPRREPFKKAAAVGISNYECCYVYLMKDVSNNYYKIGISKTPEYRERTLQSEKPTIEMICNKRLPARKIAEAFEKALHTAFADKRIRGEWFDLDENDVMLLTESLK